MIKQKIKQTLEEIDTNNQILKKKIDELIDLMDISIKDLEFLKQKRAELMFF